MYSVDHKDGFTAEENHPLTTITTLLQGTVQREFLHGNSQSLHIESFSTGSSTTSSSVTETHNYVRPEPQHHAGIFIYGFCLVLIPTATILGNLLVIISVLRFKALHSAINFLILGLAVADLLVALFVMPYAVYVYVQGGYWFLGALMCDIYSASDVSCSTASILLLAVISFDRYRAVSRPIQYSRQAQNIKRVVLIIIAIWAISFAIASPIVLGVNIRPPDANPYECRFYNPLFSIFSSLLSFVIPCVVVLFVYIRIMMALRKREIAAKMRRLASQQAEKNRDKSELESGEEAGELIAGPDEHDLIGSSTPRSSMDSLSDNANIVTNDFASEAPTSTSRKSSDYDYCQANNRAYSSQNSMTVLNSERGFSPIEEEYYGKGNTRSVTLSKFKSSLKEKARLAQPSPANWAQSGVPPQHIIPAIFRQFSRRKFFRPAILTTTIATGKMHPGQLDRNNAQSTARRKKKNTAIIRRKSDSATAVMSLRKPVKFRRNFFSGGRNTTESLTDEYERARPTSSTETDNEDTTMSTTPNPPTSYVAEQLPSNTLAATTSLTMAAVTSVSPRFFEAPHKKQRQQNFDAKAKSVSVKQNDYSPSITSSNAVLPRERNRASYSRSNTNPLLSAPVHEYSALLEEDPVGNTGSHKQKGGAFIIQNAGAKELKTVITSKDDIKSPSVTFQINCKAVGSLRRGSSAIDISQSQKKSLQSNADNTPIKSNSTNAFPDTSRQHGLSRSQNSTSSDAGPSFSYSSQSQSQTNTGISKSLESKRKLLSNSKANGSTTALAVRMVKRTINRKESSLKRKVNKSQRKEKRATKTLGIVVGIFLVCWVPFFSINIINAICVQFNEPSCEIGFGPFFYATWIGYMNSFMNPVIYTIFNTEFRRAFKSLILGRKAAARSHVNRARRMI